MFVLFLFEFFLSRSFIFVLLFFFVVFSLQIIYIYVVAFSFFLQIIHICVVELQIKNVYGLTLHQGEFSVHFEVETGVPAPSEIFFPVSCCWWGFLFVFCFLYGEHEDPGPYNKLALLMFSS